MNPLCIFTFFLDILKADFSNAKTLEHTNCLQILSSYWLAQSEIENKIWQVPAFLEFGSSKLELRLQGVGTFQKTFRRVEKYLLEEL
jgi:hypothetical protein